MESLKEYVLRNESLLCVVAVCAVDDMSAVVSKDCAGLVGHGMNDAQKSGGESDTCKTLCAVHVIAGLHIAVVGVDQVSLPYLRFLQEKNPPRRDRNLPIAYLRIPSAGIQGGTQISVIRH